jgi:hypothetical protein
VGQDEEVEPVHALRQALQPELRGGVDLHVEAVHDDVDGRPRPPVARIRRGADRAGAADHRHALRGAASEYDHVHGLGELGPRLGRTAAWPIGTKKKRPGLSVAGRSLNFLGAGSVVHAAAARGMRRSRILLLRQLGDHALGREQQPGDRGRVLQRRAGDLGRVDDAGLDEVLVLVGRDVVAVVALAGETSPTTTAPSTPAFAQSIRIGCSMARRTICEPIFSSPSRA